MSNYSTEFVNRFLSSAEICNNWLESFCVIVGGIGRTKMMRALTWSGQVSSVSNHFYVSIEYMNIPPCVDSQFYIVVKELDEICHLGWNECLEFTNIWQCLCVLEEKYCIRDSLSKEVHLLLISDNYYMKSLKLLSVLEYQGV